MKIIYFDCAGISGLYGYWSTFKSVMVSVFREMSSPSLGSGYQLNVIKRGFSWSDGTYVEEY